MAILKLADRVKETSATTGTGTLSLDGAPTGFQTFLTALGTGNSCTFLTSDGTNWEVAKGTVTSGSPNTLSRTTILASSNGGSAVNWAVGSKNVALVAPAAVASSMILLESVAASASSDVTFTTAMDSTYIEYEARWRNVVLGTDNVDLWARVAIAGTFQTANYSHVRRITESGTPDTTAATSASDAKIIIDSSLGNTSPRHLNGQMVIPNPAQTSLVKHLRWWQSGISAGGVLRLVDGFGFYNAANSAIDKLRFLASSGTISSGTFELWGRRVA